MKKRILLCSFLTAYLLGTLSGQLTYRIPEVYTDFSVYIKQPIQDISSTFIQRPVRPLPFSPAFAMGEFVTYGEYKVFVNEMAEKLPADEVKNLLPDSLFHPDPAVCDAYLSTTKFDKEPVVGISWDNALSYCLWRTRKDQPKGPLRYFYRMPTAREWIVARDHLRRKRNDIDGDLADWLFNGYRDNWWDALPSTGGINPGLLDTLSPNNLSGVQNERLVVGGNFHHRRTVKRMLRTHHHRMKGYHYVGFRLVRQYFKPSSAWVHDFRQDVIEKMKSYD